MIHVEKKDVPQVILNAFPNYRGRKFRVDQGTKVRLVDAYWSGGTKSDYVAVNLATGERFAADRVIENPLRCSQTPEVEIPVGCVIVRHSRFCGKDMGLVIYVRPENVAGMLPEPADLSEDEKRVLYYTRAYKSSYNGITRQQQSGMPIDRWNAAKEKLIAGKYLNQRGAITPKGRNASPERV